MGKKLSGMDEISQYLHWSENKVISIHKGLGLPIAKIGGQWEAHTDLLDDWVKRQLMARTGVITVSSKRAQT
jgi:hypothetical protein